MSRLVLYPKDIAEIIGKKKDAVRKLCSKIRETYDKDEEIPITVNEFCEFMNMDVDLVLRKLR